MNEIKATMEKQGITQRGILRVSDVNPTSLGLFVNLIRPLPKKHVASVAKALGVTESQLLKMYERGQRDART